jgi:hypothetical protein
MRGMWASGSNMRATIDEQKAKVETGRWKNVAGQASVKSFFSIRAEKKV